jgi:antitoxin HicB
MDIDGRYTIEIFWSEEDEGYIAIVPDLPGCSAYGETREEAAKEVAQAMDAWLGAAQKAGFDIPMPVPHRTLG